MAVGEQQRHRAGDHRQGEDDHDRLGEHRPAEEGQARPAHAAGAHVGDRHGDVQRAEDRARAGQVDEVDPRVGPVAGDVGPRGERGVRRPARLRGTEEHRGVEHGSAGEVEPIRQRVEPREGHVARAHLQRHEVVREARPQRHDHEEDHRGAVHREHLVVDLWGQQRVVGLGELGAHQQRLDSPERHERERRDQVEHADPLVIGRAHPTRPAAAGHGLDAVSDELRRRRGRLRDGAGLGRVDRHSGPSGRGRAVLAGGRRVRGVDQALLPGHPAGVGGRCDAAHPGDHLGVVAPAQLRALAACRRRLARGGTTCG